MEVRRFVFILFCCFYSFIFSAREIFWNIYEYKRYLSPFAAILASYVALRGLDAWQKQLRYKDKKEVVEGLIKKLMH